MVSLASRGKPIQRGFFDRLFGGKKREATAPSIVVNKEQGNQREEHSFKKQVLSKEEEKYIKRRDALLETLEKKRDEYDKELIARRKEIETASVASKREFEITVANLDYNKVILDSLSLDTASNFESPEEILAYLAEILNKGVDCLYSSMD